ncbi:YybH family protein [Granulicella arctica]|uniref:Ketosteroid isomerase-like protein n=1 Tax=Granulicella arctica TaxID=940613 RepID=A0A7Y9THL3_9BACT|nr:nuclear transport factor 2 family protein [Granulicella arctica]NYF81206.1 ketosteroid isomerase-like protein [Granulicella arctica]
MPLFSLIPHQYHLPMVRLTALLCTALTLPLAAQLGPAPTTQSIDPLAPPRQVITNPLNQPTVTPGQLLLLDLDLRFSKDVETRGGKAFRDWFALDGVVLNNGKAPVLGFRAITADTDWDPKTYQLTWTTEGAQMGPSNDMGFTWGRYVSHAKDKTGNPIDTAGRYITVWKKIEDGKWKVAMDASANDAPLAGSCCTLPKP